MYWYILFITITAEGFKHSKVQNKLSKVDGHVAGGDSFITECWQATAAVWLSICRVLILNDATLLLMWILKIPAHLSETGLTEFNPVQQSEVREILETFLQFKDTFVTDNKRWLHFVYKPLLIQCIFKLKQHRQKGENWDRQE